MRLRSVVGILRHYPRLAEAVVGPISLSEVPSLLRAYENAAREGRGASAIRLKGETAPVVLRSGTSDFDVFYENLIIREYDVIPQIADVRTIIDAGCNIGLSTRYLLQRFPQATAIAIEADRNNYEMACDNLSHLSSRCTVVHGALWYESGCVTTTRGEFRDGRDWSFQVRADQDGELKAYSPAELMQVFEIDQIDVLKIDIEGAETALFERADSFMTHVRCCAVELHDDAASKAFAKACTKYGFSTMRRRETSVALCQPVLG